MTGAIALYVIALTATFILTVSGIQYHINIFRNPVLLILPISLAVFLPLSIIYSLPVDYISSNWNEGTGLFRLPEKLILYLWKFNYWSTFCLTWILLPVLQEFFRSGHFSKAKKVKEALKRNLKYQLAILGVSVGAVVYLILEAGFSFMHLKLMIIAMSHIYALALALWLLAHGLVGIPKDMWTAGNLMQNLNNHYIKVPKLVDNLEDTKILFKEDILKVMLLTKNFAENTNSDTFYFRDWILDLYYRIPLDLKNRIEQHLGRDTEDLISRDQINVSFMKNLSSSFSMNCYRYKAYQAEFDYLLERVTKLEDIINASSNDNLSERYKVRYRIHVSSRLLKLSPRGEYIYQCYIRPTLKRVMSVVLFALSFLVLESELFHSTAMSLINRIMYSKSIHGRTFVSLLFSGIFFSYMLFCALNSLTHMKVFNMYHLVPHGSDPVSACFYATYIARLTIPLSYNFITLFVSRKSVFEKWYGGSIHLSGFFDSMNNWLPRLILIPVLFTVLNVYDRLKGKIELVNPLQDTFGFLEEQGDDEANGLVGNTIGTKRDLYIVEAKRIVDREMLLRTRLLWNRENDASEEYNLSNLTDRNTGNNFSDHETTLTHVSNNPADPFELLFDESSLGGGIGPTGFIRNSVSTNIRGIGRAIASKLFGRGDNAYRDILIDDFNYDDDANEDLVL